jgi:hypothetical protein
MTTEQAEASIDADDDTPVPAPLDETALRRPEFDPESVPIVLIDGQAWHFPPAGIGPIRPRVEGGRCVGLVAGSGFGDEFDATLAELDATTDAVAARLSQEGEYAPPAEFSPLKMARGLFALAIFLLSRNYAIPDAAWPRLLSVDFNTGRYMAMWSRILAHARGQSAADAPDDPAEAIVTETPAAVEV